ncbi:TolC family protein [Salinimonas sediminis]|uniref:TolC family protein n=1 Tax=Salinimonas sediminis TaxID=2303538 RepID=A0A346NJ64_9ALTE|nr:TolC family protein [Salinimonas sediminis]AXR05571.1 TolC family protein [Salinimonas sediminis]
MNSFFSHARERMCFVIVGCVWLFISPATQSKAITLEQATRLTLQQHPDLQRYQSLLKATKADKQQATLTPAYKVGVEAENLLGSGDAAGINEAELTVSLSSVFEMEGKRTARVALVDANLSLVQSERYVASLALLSELTRQYVKTIAAKERLTLAQTSVSFADEALSIVAQRVEKGATNKAELLRARAALNQAKVDTAFAATALAIAKQSLALFWRGAGEEIDEVSGSLNNLPQKRQYSAVYQQFLESANVERLTDAINVKEAEQRLVESNASADISWRVGVRRSQAVQDTSVVAGISTPLFAAQRNKGALQAALAKKKAAVFARDSQMLEIKALLFSAQQYLNFSVDAVKHINDIVLPDLKAATTLVLEGYQQGIYSYQDWITSTDALIRTREKVIEYSENALLNQSLIEQWTGLSGQVSPTQDMPEYP